MAEGLAAEPTAVSAGMSPTVARYASVEGAETVTDQPAGSASSAKLDRLVDDLDYPMFIVTAAREGRQAGCLVGFATQASIDPALLLVCVSVRNRTHSVAQHATALGVHLLGPDQRALAALFGSTTGDDVDKFARCRWALGDGGVPLLTDCPRRMAGRIVERHPLGDHTGFLLAPVTLDAASGPVLTFQDLHRPPPGHPA